MAEPRPKTESLTPWNMVLIGLGLMALVVVTTVAPVPRKAVDKAPEARPNVTHMPAVTGGASVPVDEPDFGPYIAELQRRIKRNWQPPLEHPSRRVVIVFTVGRDGQLLGQRFDPASGDAAIDQSAMAALRASAPFKLLPAAFKGESVDVQFVFDYSLHQSLSL